MPQNTQANRFAHKYLLGHGSGEEADNPHWRICRGMCAGTRLRMVKKMALYPDVLFSRKDGRRWVPVCAEDKCFETIDDKSLPRGLRHCKKHRCLWFNGYPVLTSAAIRAHHNGLLLKVDNANKTQIDWVAKCSAKECDGVIHLATAYGKSNDICKACKRKSTAQLIAGQYSSSQKIIRDKSLIIAWHITPSGQKSPLCRCTVTGCEGVVYYKASWSSAQKLQILCHAHSIQRKLRKRPYESSYNLMVAAARKRKIRVTLTYADYLDLCKIPNCHYCSDPISRLMHRDKKNRKSKMAYFLDRKDSSEGYTISNVVPCCGPCNITKCEWLCYEEMLIIGRLRKGNAAEAKRLIDDSEPAFANHRQLLRKKRHWRTVAAELDAKLRTGKKNKT